MHACVLALIMITGACPLTNLCPPWLSPALALKVKGEWVSAGSRSLSQSSSPPPSHSACSHWLALIESHLPRALSVAGVSGPVTLIYPAVFTILKRAFDWISVDDYRTTASNCLQWKAACKNYVGLAVLGRFCISFNDWCIN